MDRHFPVSTQSSPQRSTRSKQRPDWYSHHVAALTTEELDPYTVREAQSSPNSTKWKKAMEREMKSLHSNKVWELVEPLPDPKIVGSKWIFKCNVEVQTHSALSSVLSL